MSTTPENQRTACELRTFGGLGLIWRMLGKQVEVFAVKDDESKQEVSSLLPMEQGYWSGNRLTWSLPGGGRGKNTYELSETLRQTTASELNEEIQPKSRNSEDQNSRHHRYPEVLLPRRTKNRSQLRQFHEPFAVAQNKADRIDHIAVQILPLPFEYFRSDAQQTLETCVYDENALWIDCALLEDMFQNIKSGRPWHEQNVNGLGVRPQFLAAAFIWISQFLKKIDITVPIQQGNYQVHEFIQVQGKPIRNGSFDELGNIDRSILNRRDKEFLFGRPRT